jgi:hypothetical protein
MVAKLRPSSDCMAFSALLSNVATDDERALNTTFPLDNSVRTSEKPSASKQFFSSGILAFMGLTPRRNATYLGMGFDCAVVASCCLTPELAEPRSGFGLDELLGLTVVSPTLEPAPDAPSVLLPSCAMGPGQPRLFTEHDPQLKGDDDGERIDEQAGRTKRDGPAQQNQGHAHIHGVAAVAVQADDHQFLRWRPRCERAFAGYVKVPSAPQQTERAECDRNQAEGPMQCEMSEPDPGSRHQKCHDAG